MYKALLTRKMVMYYIAIAVLTFLTWSGKLSGDNFLIAFVSVNGVSVAGNVISKKYPLQDESKQEQGI